MINSVSISTSEKSSKKNTTSSKARANPSPTFFPKRQSNQNYTIIRSEYLDSIYMQEIDKIIKKISYYPKLFHQFRCQPIYMLLSHTVQVLMLNLIEVSIFAQLLKKTLNSNTLPAEIFLFYIGWSVKKFFGSDLQCLVEHLKTKFMNFEENFENWEKTSGIFLDFDLKEVNLLFMQGRQGVLEMNLNFYVDGILHSSPPYHIESKEVMNSILSEKSQCREEGVEGNEDVCCGIYERVHIALSKYSLENFEDRDKRAEVDKSKYLLQISQYF
jgi:hypothetical protein